MSRRQRKGKSGRINHVRAGSHSTVTYADERRSGFRYRGSRAMGSVTRWTGERGPAASVEGRRGRWVSGRCR